MNLGVPSNAGNFLTTLGPVTLSSKDSAPWSWWVRVQTVGHVCNSLHYPTGIAKSPACVSLLAAEVYIRRKTAVYAEDIPFILLLHAILKWMQFQPQMREKFKFGLWVPLPLPFSFTLIHQRKCAQVPKSRLRSYPFKHSPIHYAEFTLICTVGFHPFFIGHEGP